MGGGGAHFGGGGGGHIGGGARMGGGGGFRMGGGGAHMGGGGGVPRSFGGTPHIGGNRGGSIGPSIGGSPNIGGIRGGSIGGVRNLTPGVPRSIGHGGANLGAGGRNLGNSLNGRPGGVSGLPRSGGLPQNGSALHGGQLNGSRGIPNLYNATRTTPLHGGRALNSPQIGGGRNPLGVTNASAGRLPHLGAGTPGRGPSIHGSNFIGSQNSALRHGGGPGNLGNIHRVPYAGNSLRFGNRNVNLAGAGYRPSYYRHPWYHGYWNRGGFNTGFWLGYGLGSFGNGYGWGFGPGYGYGRYGRFGYGGYGYGGYGYGLGGYGYCPVGWGYGGWGLGSLAYGSGYLSYSNPYCVNGYGAGVYDYTQPIPITYNPSGDDAVASADPTVAAPATNSSERQLEAAVGAFRQGNYDAAIDTVDRAIVAHPDDAVLHEFRALALFARRDYQQAAATVHSVLAVGPGWDWDTLSSIYADADDYTPQLRALEAYTVKYPDDAASSFLLAYHYLCDGHPDAALRELKTVVRLKPDDRVASELVKMISAPTVDPKAQAAPAAGQGSATLPVPPVPSPDLATPADPTPASGPAIAVAQVAGDWSASRGDGSEFQLKLQPDMKFTWTFSNKQTPATSFEGTYTIDGNVIALERKDGGSLIAELTQVEGKKFHFKLAGALKEDPGLEFLKK